MWPALSRFGETGFDSESISFVFNGYPVEMRYSVFGNVDRAKFAFTPELVSTWVQVTSLHARNKLSPWFYLGACLQDDRLKERFDELSRLRFLNGGDDHLREWTELAEKALTGALEDAWTEADGDIDFSVLDEYGDPVRPAKSTG